MSERTGKTERSIDTIMDNALNNIDLRYRSALRVVFRKNSVFLSSIRDIMNGVTKPPRYCITDKMKERWKQRELNRLLRESSFIPDMVRAMKSCGGDSVSVIQSALAQVYNTAYNGTMEKLV